MATDRIARSSPPAPAARPRRPGALRSRAPAAASAKGKATASKSSGRADIAPPAQPRRPRPACKAARRPAPAPPAPAAAAPCRRIAKRCNPAPAAAPVSLYWGALVGDQLTGDKPPWDMDALAQFEAMAGKASSLVQFLAPFAECSSSDCSFYEFPTKAMEDIRNHGSIPFFSWSSQSIPSSLDQPDFQLSDVISGAYDSYIRECAGEAKRVGPPLLPPLQLGDERQLVPLVGGRQRQPAGRVRRRLAPRPRHLRRGRRDQRDLGLVPQRRPRPARCRTSLPSTPATPTSTGPASTATTGAPTRPTPRPLAELRRALRLDLPRDRRHDRPRQADGDRRGRLDRVRRLQGGLDRGDAGAAADRVPADPRRCSGSRSSTTTWTGRSRPRAPPPAPSPQASRAPPTSATSRRPRRRPDSAAELSRRARRPLPYTLPLVIAAATR